MQGHNIFTSWINTGDDWISLPLATEEKAENSISYSSYLSFWQTKRLKAFSAPRKLSSSKISTALIQLGLKSRAICKIRYNTNSLGQKESLYRNVSIQHFWHCLNCGITGRYWAKGWFSSPSRGCIMHEHRSRQASRGGTKLCKYPWRHSHTKLWNGRLKRAYNSYSVCESKLCPTFRTHHNHMESQRKFLWRQWNTIIASPSTLKLLSLSLLANYTPENM